MDDIGDICQETENNDVLVWSPNHNLSDAELDEFLSIAKEKHGYNMEQALGMLFWHNHDIKKALEDLNNFTPVSEEWTLAEKALFEQGFSIHGKLFHKIQQMLPGKSIQSIVKYYYSWKKSSVMGQNAHKQKRKRKGRGKKIANEDQEKDSKKLKKSRK